MLTPASALVVALGLTLPIVIAVLVTIVVLAIDAAARLHRVRDRLRMRAVSGLALRAPIFESEAVSEFRDQLQGGPRLAFNLLYLLVPATLVGFVFEGTSGRLAAVLAVMTIAATGARIPQRFERQPHASVGTGHRRCRAGPQAKHVPAGRGRFCEPGLHGCQANRRGGIQGLVEGQTNSGFTKTRFPTITRPLDSMLSMLEMRHHYYRASHKVLRGEPGSAAGRRRRK